MIAWQWPSLSMRNGMPVPLYPSTTALTLQTSPWFHCSKPQLGTLTKQSDIGWSALKIILARLETDENCWTRVDGWLLSTLPRRCWIERLEAHHARPLNHIHHPASKLPYERLSNPWISMDQCMLADCLTTITRLGPSSAWEIIIREYSTNHIR